MDGKADLAKLHEDHTIGAIAARLAAPNEQSYLGDFVLGSIDGTVTTFAIVSGVAGAGYSTGVAVVLGLANVLADGFSMAVGNFLKARSDHELIERARSIEEHHIEHVPDGEREEIRQIFAKKGFAGDLLHHIVAVITEDRKQWVDTMLIEEHGLSLEPPDPLRAAIVTFASFVLAGLIPIFPLFFATGLEMGSMFAMSTAATGVTFFTIGLFKGRVVHGAMWLSAVETLLMGGGAAVLAYAVGRLLRDYGGA